MRITSGWLTANYPAGVTQRDIDNLCQPDNSFPNREECVLCGRMIEQDDDTRRWYYEEDVADLGMNYLLGYGDALDAFEMTGGWCCSVGCFNDHVEPTPQEEDAYLGIHLVKAVRA